MVLQELLSRKRKIKDLIAPLQDVTTQRNHYIEEKANAEQIHSLDVELYRRFIETRAEFYRNNILPLFVQTLNSLAEVLKGSGETYITGPIITPQGSVSLEWNFRNKVTFHFYYDRDLESNSDEVVYLNAKSDREKVSHYNKVIKIASKRKRPYIHFSEDENRKFFVIINNDIAEFLKRNIVHKNGEIQVK